jgi:2-polyprenyl-3-methyl-5-hydroxy-6-metoxy-1,4-benzoquinol methylase
VASGDTVVALGCASGCSGRWFAQRGATYLGIDLRVDLIVSFWTLEHLVWPSRYLDEMLRLCKRGGHLLLAFPDFGNWPIVCAGGFYGATSASASVSSS